MGAYKHKKRLLLVVVFAAIVAAVFDYIVRTYTLGWTEASISQWFVFFSPLIYFVLFTLILFKLRNTATGISHRSNISVAVLLITFSTLVLAQVFLRKQSVGSATYSIVSPLFISGIPQSILTFSLFFRKTRDTLQSYLICIVVVLWVVMPIGIDTLYRTQGGYRGPGLVQIAVVSTSYAFVQYLAVFGLFVALITALVAVLMTIQRAIKAKGIDRIYSFALGLSVFTLSIQFVNWGRFVSD